MREDAAEKERESIKDIFALHQSRLIRDRLIPFIHSIFAISFFNKFCFAFRFVSFMSN